MDYFSSLGFIPELAMNPAEYLLDLATGQVNGIRIPEKLQEITGSQDVGKNVVKVIQASQM